LVGEVAVLQLAVVGEQVVVVAVEQTLVVAEEQLLPLVAASSLEGFVGPVGIAAFAGIAVAVAVVAAVAAAGIAAGIALAVAVVAAAAGTVAVAVEQVDSGIEALALVETEVEQLFVGTELRLVGRRMPMDMWVEKTQLVVVPL
jgi:hypothetical protein